MSQNMYGVRAQVYAPLGSGRLYIADPVTALITAVDDGDVGQMIEMGCAGQAVAEAAGAESSVTSVATRTGAVTLSHSDISGLGSAALVATSTFDAAGAATAAAAASVAKAAPMVLTSQISTPGAATGTLTNAPAAGDAQTWLQVTINGVMHWIPAWHA